MEISRLEPGSKFSLSGRKELQGVVLSHTPMGTTVYWYSIPDKWNKKHYTEEDGKDKKGNIYLGMDTLFHNKKMIIGSEAQVFEITTTKKGKKDESTK